MPYDYIPEETKSRFFVPKTLASDFTEFLENDIPGSVASFGLVHDWYDQFKEGYTALSIRGEIYPDSTKSRYSNTDNNLNFRASVASGIRKGDMIVDPDGVIYILDWEIAPQPNNRASRALRCNAKLTFTRYQEETVDSDGYLVSEGGDVAISEDLPCNAYRYDGRPEYSSVSGAPGVVPNALTIVTVQYNDKTANLKINDEFVWANEEYIVIDINYVGIDLINGRGTMTIQAKKKAGGET